MTTISATVDLYISDARSRRKLIGLRAAHGDIVNHSQETIQIKVGASKDYVFSRFFYAHIRDVVDVTFTDANDNTTTWQAVTGVLALPFAGKVTLAVSSSSSIVLDRVVNLVYG